MRKASKISLIVAAAFVLLGLAILTAILAKCNWDFSDLSTTQYRTKTYTSSSAISNIFIDSSTADVCFFLAEDDFVTVECYEIEKSPHEVSFDAGNLVIDEDDQRKWYEHIGINFDTPKIKVYLPRSAYSALDIDITTGDVSIPSDFSFQSITIEATTSDVELSASATDTLTVKTTTGDVNITNARINTIVLLNSTGDMTLTNVNSKTIYTSGTTGDIYMKNVIAEKNINITRSTGDVEFKKCDSKSIYIQVSTGDVTGDLLTGKIFSAESSTGKVNVPENIPNGTCVIITSTGNIRISAG